jgi:hypothetical protein
VERKKKKKKVSVEGIQLEVAALRCFLIKLLETILKVRLQKGSAN